MQTHDSDDESNLTQDGDEWSQAVELTFAELNDPQAEEIVLDGHSASADELARARHTVSLLRGLLPRLKDTADAAQVSHEIGVLLGWPLEDHEGAVEQMRDAYQRQPSSLRYARGHRKAAMRTKNARELATALENEAKLSQSRRTRALLSIRRARLLESQLENPEAARFGYIDSLDAEPHVDALEALERLARQSREWTDAATFAQRLAALVTDTTIRAEHLARAARYLDRSGDSRGALALAVQAHVHAPESPAISFTVERLVTADKAWAELVSLRQRQIETQLVDPAAGWFDAGLIARYRLNDSDRAIRCFQAAVDASDDEAVESMCLAQLAAALEQEGRWRELVEVDKRRLRRCNPEQKARFWHRIAATYDERLGDPGLAAQAYDYALEADPTWAPALEGAGRLVHGRDEGGDEGRQRLLRMHRLQARAATTHEARGDAWRRVGELLIEEEATRDEGLDALREALTELPGNLCVLHALERGLSKKGDWKMLVDLYEHQLETEEDRGRRAWLLAQMGLIAADRLGDHARAIGALKQHMELDEQHPTVPLTRLAELLEDGSDDVTLIAVLNAIAATTRTDTERASVLQRIAAVQERRGAIGEAIDAYTAAIAIAPPTHPVYADAGRAFLRAGRYEQLLEVLRAGCRGAAPADSAYWLTKAAHVLDRRLGRTDEAIATLASALAQDATLEEARESLSHLLSRTRRWGELEELLAASDGEGELFMRAIVAEAMDDPAAVDLYAQALDGGEVLAWLPYTRLAAHAGRWEDLEARYASVDGALGLVHHARYRAGEIAVEQLEQRARGIQHWLASHAANKPAIAPLVALAPFDAELEGPDELVASLQASTRDIATRMACLGKRIADLDRRGQRAEALAARLDGLSLHPSEPWLLAEVENELERTGDRITLANVLRAAAEDAQLEVELQPSVQASLGSVLEQLGALGEAVVAYEASLEQSVVSRVALLGLRRCYDAMEDDRVGQVLAQISSCPPVGPEQALGYRALAWWWMERGDSAAAVVALEGALRAHPCDYDALNDYLEIAGEESPVRATDAMLRAFELESDPQLSERLGRALATRLLRSDRVEAAREVVERLLEAARESVKVLMLHEQLLEHRSNWRAAARVLDRIASHDDARARCRVEALLRLAAIQSDHLHDEEAAKRTTKRLLALDAAGELSTEARLDVEEALGDHEAAAASLEELSNRAELSEAERGPLLLRLAALQDVELNQPGAALATLSRVRDVDSHEQAAAQLLALGQEQGRWEVVADALASMLRHEGLEPRWEAALRRRLGDVLQRHLQRASEAFREFERVVELEPHDMITLVTLAEMATAESAERALSFHRRLLAIDPLRVSSYRALRQLFLQLDQVDGAFCAEATLVGLNEADEEERYFYRQRRPELTQRTDHILEEGDVDLLLPARNTPAFELFRALDEVLPAMFAVDMSAYGVVDEGAAESHPLAAVAAEMARFVGGAPHRMVLASARSVPTSELGRPSRVIVPRSLEDALRREQQFVCGAILGRVRFGGVATDPCRATALDGSQIDHLLRAACELAGVAVDPADVHPAGSAIREDLKTRVDALLSGDARERVFAAARRYALAPVPMGDAIVKAHLEASLKIAALASRDPNVAVRCLRIFGAMFSNDALIGHIPTETLSMLPFSISPEHLQIRARLGVRRSERS